jgi:hypothetical protein
VTARESAIGRCDDALAEADGIRRAALVARTALRETKTLDQARRLVRDDPHMTDDIRSAALALLDHKEDTTP